MKFRRRIADEQFDRELRFHIETLIDEHIAAGLSAEEARRKAMLEFGGKEQIKEQLRDVRRLPVWDGAVSNLKSAFRFIRKSPSFSITIVLTLALGIGANSAVFSALDAVLLRPLPFPEAGQPSARHASSSYWQRISLVSKKSASTGGSSSIRLAVLSSPRSCAASSRPRTPLAAASRALSRE